MLKIQDGVAIVGKLNSFLNQSYLKRNWKGMEHQYQPTPCACFAPACHTSIPILTLFALLKYSRLYELLYILCPVSTDTHELTRVRENSLFRTDVQICEIFFVDKPLRPRVLVTVLKIKNLYHNCLFYVL